MARFFKKREEIKGLSPGSLIFIGNKKVENQDTLPPGNSSDTFGAIRAGISPELIDESHIGAGVVNFGLIERLK
jgi:hypothetical protein